MMMPLELNNDFVRAFELMENSSKSIFITGKAGTGKSTLLKYFKAKTKKNIAIVAPTGIAAMNVGGQTIHSFFGFPPRPLTSQDIKKRRNRKLYQKLDILIIDEISMVRADMLDAISFFLQLNRDNELHPFGGLQVIFIGDLFQLPPIIKEEERMMLELTYETPYFFSSLDYKELSVKCVELTTIYRQNDEHFIHLLNQVRTRNIDYYTLQNLNQRLYPNYIAPISDGWITLSTTNSIANRLNERYLNQLTTKNHIYIGKITGDFRSNVLPTHQVLNFKKGAQVMFVKNDRDGRWVNGTLGEIFDLSKEFIMVMVKNDAGDEMVFEVKKEIWEMYKYVFVPTTNTIETEVIGTFEQFPLKLAWGVTIHKSQGMTFDKVVIDVGRGAFAAGQVYVALSRCTSLEGIVLRKQIQATDIKVDDQVLEFAASNQLL